MTTPARALDIAAQLLRYANEADRRLTPMQVLKLVYISHGWTLGLLSRSLIPEAAEAWRYGPVVRVVYQKYRRYRGNPIEESGADRRALMDADQNEVVRQVSQKYARFTGIQLSALTHQPGSPWDLTWRSGLTVIPNPLIEDHYRRRAEEAGGTR
jgi:uncharacterized phage-associated protein